MTFKFKRIAIINRGESAMRFLRAFEEVKEETGGDLVSIAFYTEPDARSLFVRHADSHFCLGPATFIDKDGHKKSSYLNLPLLESALLKTQADAVWVGWGFVAEDPAFAYLCAKLGITFIGPSGEVMQNLGDKIASKKLAEQANVPVSPWSGGELTSLEHAKEVADKLGFPLMLKATAGGGGRGIRKILSHQDLENVFTSARDEARKSFGNDAVFLERMISGARHIEVQVVADLHGNVFAPGVRDCTIQRNNQKVVEEAPSPVLCPALENDIKNAAIRMAKIAKYQNVGTAEFLFMPSDQSFFFMEMNTRLQVEHTVTELTTGLDLVKLQLRIANGEKITSLPSEAKGHAIEVRLNAENPDAGFAPAPGHVRFLVPPSGLGIRVDTGISQGDDISSDFDSMVAKIIAHGSTRSEALARLIRALKETTVVIDGGTTNKSFLLSLLRNPDLVACRTDIGWLDRTRAQSKPTPPPHADLAVIAAAIEIYEREHKIECQEFLHTAYRGRPKCRDEATISAELSLYGQSLKLAVEKRGKDAYMLQYNGQKLAVTRDKLANCRSMLTLAEQKYSVVCMAAEDHFLIEINGVSHRIATDAGGLIRSPAAALVLSILVKPGDIVKANQRLCVLEAMKMETSINSPSEGKIKEILASPNTQVAAGAPLLVLEKGAETSSTDGNTFIWPSLPNPPLSLEQRWIEYLDACDALISGYDVDVASMQKSAKELTVQQKSFDRSIFHARERSVLEKSATLFTLALSQGLGSDEQVHAASDCLINFIRKMNPEDKSLPEVFTTQLKKMLAFAGIETLNRSPALEDALWAIWRAFTKLEQISDAIGAIFKRELQDFSLGQTIASEFHTVSMNILAAIKEHFPTFANLLAFYQFKVFAEQNLKQEKQEACELLLEKMSTLIHTNMITPEDAQEIIECPWPMINFTLEQMQKSSAQVKRWLQEILVWRFYRDRQFETTTVHNLDEHIVLQMHYKVKGPALEIISTAATIENFDSLLVKVWDMFSKPRGQGDVLLDLFLWNSGNSIDTVKFKEHLLTFINEKYENNPIKRLCVYLANPNKNQSSLCFTFQYTSSGAYVEDPLTGEIHPLEAKRFELWRYRNFSLERLPSTAEDICVFRAKAKENPKDDRLLVFSEIRDATPMPRAPGKPLELPFFERNFIEACMTLREVTAQLPHLPSFSGINFFVMPPLTGQERELVPLVRRLIPYAENLNIDEITVRAKVWNRRANKTEDWTATVSYNRNSGLRISRVYNIVGQIPAKSRYEQNVSTMKARSLFYPYDLLQSFITGIPPNPPRGTFTEYDIISTHEAPEEILKKASAFDKTLAPILRTPGQNSCNVVVGIISHITEKYPEGMRRVCIVSDPSRDMGSLAEPECLRIILALNLAEQLHLPVEWFTVSSGAKIDLNSGTENLDWTARTLRRIVQFTERGGEINIVATGINVGAQAYWDAEATMHMHNRGILIMLPEAAIVLTGKKALDYSGSVSAENNQGIGGGAQIMGPNGQAQYLATNLQHAFNILLDYYNHSYICPSEKTPRIRNSKDSPLRDIGDFPHSGEFATVGEIFSAEKNPGRKKPFDIRTVMRALSDNDVQPLERWDPMLQAETAVVWDTHLGGHPVLLLGIESRPLLRFGSIPGDGPDTWTGGTLFPNSSKKLARAINSASGNRPIVVLANLSGFDGSPESMRNWQLEYGSELGRAVVNCKSPILVAVLTRFHGGAYVVFSKALNENLEIVALEGAFASVIGGTPAAAVVFPGEVKARTLQEKVIKEFNQRIKEANKEERPELMKEFNILYKNTYLQKQAELAEEFDKIHNIERAKQVGSIGAIIDKTSFRNFAINHISKFFLKHD